MVADVTPDGKLLPEKYDFDPVTGKPTPAGVPVGGPKNDYQVYKNGDDISVRRVPDKSSYSQTELTDQLQNGGLVRIDFNLNTTRKVEMPSGNEWGANDQWIPGGKTSGGASEAIIKTEGMQLNVDYVVNGL